jgi:hypothetical protein
MTGERIPPHAADLEAFVLGALLQEPRAAGSFLTARGCGFHATD